MDDRHLRVQNLSFVDSSLIRSARQKLKLPIHPRKRDFEKKMKHLLKIDTCEKHREQRKINEQVFMFKFPRRVQKCMIKKTKIIINIIMWTNIVAQFLTASHNWVKEKQPCKYLHKGKLIFT